MKFQASGTESRQPRIVAERTPLRPVQIATVRAPIQVTKPMSLGHVARSTEIVTVRLTR
ncbi:MAG: hypothetical protein ACRD3V_22645 [Vicinamibacteria bacterium]